jgi:hypothetical protein
MREWKRSTLYMPAFRIMPEQEEPIATLRESIVLLFISEGDERKAVSADDAAHLVRNEELVLPSVRQICAGSIPAAPGELKTLGYFAV